MEFFPVYQDADCEAAMQFIPPYQDIYVPAVPSVGVNPDVQSFFASLPQATEEMFNNPDDQSYDGSETGSAQQGCPDSNDNVFRAVPDMDSVAVSQGDLDLLEQADAEPARPHKRKMKSRVSLANLTEEERLTRRRKKNREAAQLSRQRKMVRLDTLEQQVSRHKAVNQTLIHECEIIKRESQALRKEVAYLKMVLGKSLSVANVFGVEGAEPAAHPDSFLVQ